jgi:hypothetical protein
VRFAADEFRNAPPVVAFARFNGCYQTFLFQCRPSTARCRPREPNLACHRAPLPQRVWRGPEHVGYLEGLLEGAPLGIPISASPGRKANHVR